MMMSFIQDCMNNIATANDIDAYVTSWHESGNDVDCELYEYLGMTFAEYSVWAVNPDFLICILAARKYGFVLTRQ
jgi:hypothetical protein